MIMDAPTQCWNISETDYPVEAPLADCLTFLLGYAILAPSIDNTQPWLFRVQDRQIDVMADYTRWLQVADSDQRAMHIAIGCALENLLIAAEHFDLEHEAILVPHAGGPPMVASVSFHEGGAKACFRDDVLFEMIPIRHSNYGHYEDRPISQSILRQFQRLCPEEGIVLKLTDDEQIKRQVDDLLIRGDLVEFTDPAFREELAYWIGRGAFGTGRLMSRIEKLAVSYLDLSNFQAKRDSENLKTSPILGLISSAYNDRRSQVQSGQIYERVALLAASHGIRCQPLSQIVQVPELKQELAALIPSKGRTPQYLFRMGYALPERQHTPRRPVQDVVI